MMSQLGDYKTLYIRNVLSTSYVRARQHFGQYGEITRFYISTKEPTGHVIYKKVEDAKKARAELNNRLFDGKMLEVQFSFVSLNDQGYKNSSRRSLVRSPSHVRRSRSRFPRSPSHACRSRSRSPHSRIRSRRSRSRSLRDRSRSRRDRTRSRRDRSNSQSHFRRFPIQHDQMGSENPSVYLSHEELVAVVKRLEPGIHDIDGLAIEMKSAKSVEKPNIASSSSLRVSSDLPNSVEKPNVASSSSLQGSSVLSKSVEKPTSEFAYRKALDEVISGNKILNRIRCMFVERCTPLLVSSFLLLRLPNKKKCDHLLLWNH